MKDAFDQVTTRLLGQASRAPAREDDAMPFGFDTRVLARLKQIVRPSEFSFFIPLARGVLAIALVVMLISLGTSWYRLHSKPIRDIATPGEVFPMGLVR